MPADEPAAASIPPPAPHRRICPVPGAKITPHELRKPISRRNRIRASRQVRIVKQ
jgi:hypothetical protein